MVGIQYVFGNKSHFILQQVSGKWIVIVPYFVGLFTIYMCAFISNYLLDSKLHGEHKYGYEIILYQERQSQEHGRKLSKCQTGKK